MALGAAVLLGPILGAFAKLLSTETLKFVATRAMLYSLFTLVLPVILYNVFSMILSETLTYAVSKAGSANFQGSVVQLTGMAAWIADRIDLAQCVSIFLSACGLRFVLSFFHR